MSPERYGLDRDRQALAQIGINEPKPAQRLRDFAKRRPRLVLSGANAATRCLPVVHIRSDPVFPLALEFEPKT